MSRTRPELQRSVVRATELALNDCTCFIPSNTCSRRAVTYHKIVSVFQEQAIAYSTSLFKNSWLRKVSAQEMQRRKVFDE